MSLVFLCSLIHPPGGVCTDKASSLGCMLFGNRHPSPFPLEAAQKQTSFRMLGLPLLLPKFKGQAQAGGQFCWKQNGLGRSKKDSKWFKLPGITVINMISIVALLPKNMRLSNFMFIPKVVTSQLGWKIEILYKTC